MVARTQQKRGDQRFSKNSCHQRVASSEGKRAHVHDLCARCRQSRRNWVTFDVNVEGHTLLVRMCSDCGRDLMHQLENALAVTGKYEAEEEQQWLT